MTQGNSGGAAKNKELPIDTFKDRVCECGGMIFMTAHQLKELPAEYSPSQKKETFMLQVGFVCARCGKQLSLRPE